MTSPIHRKLLVRIDSPSEDSDTTSLMLYGVGDTFALVVTEEKSGDAEIFLKKEQLTQLRQRLDEVLQSEKKRA
jgi:hypothetical protein